jgi:hypothetical protein
VIEKLTLVVDPVLSTRALHAGLTLKPGKVVPFKPFHTFAALNRESSAAAAGSTPLKVGDGKYGLSPLMSTLIRGPAHIGDEANNPNSTTIVLKMRMQISFLESGLVDNAENFVRRCAYANSQESRVIFLAGIDSERMADLN